MLTLRQARAIAAEYHGTQKDKSGRPYLEHLEAVQVGAMILGANLEVRAAAILHDVVEDTTCTIAKLKEFGASERQIKVIDTLTKRTGEQQTDYLDAIVAAGPDAMRVKLADLFHNTRPDRVAVLDEYTARRMQKKYMPAIARLMQELGYIMTTADYQAIPAVSYTATSSVYASTDVWKDRKMSWCIKGDEVKVGGKDDVLVREVEEKTTTAKTIIFKFTDGTTMRGGKDREVWCRTPPFESRRSKKTTPITYPKPVVKGPSTAPTVSKGSQRVKTSPPKPITAATQAAMACNSGERDTDWDWLSEQGAW